MSLPTLTYTMITLPEICEIVLSGSPDWIKYTVSKKLESRWSYLRNSYLNQNNSYHVNLVKDSCDAFGVVRKRKALPYLFAFQHVPTWIPWALHEIKKELDNNISYVGGITQHQINVGSNAPEEYYN